MSRNALIFLCSIIITASSCNKQEFYGKRLDGKWIYERACYQEKAFKQTDILDDYRHLDVIFTAEGGLEILDVNDNTYYKGFYEIDEDFTAGTDPNGNGTSNSSIDLVLSYEDTATNKNYLEIWDQASIGKKKIRFQKQIDGKRAFFVLKKQND